MFKEKLFLSHCALPQQDLNVEVNCDGDVDRDRKTTIGIGGGVVQFHWRGDHGDALLTRPRQKPRRQRLRSHGDCTTTLRSIVRTNEKKMYTACYVLRKGKI